MEVHLRKPEREDLSLTFGLSPFITDWVPTQTRFIAAIVRDLGELGPVRSLDFKANSSPELGESRCTYRIFGGASTIILDPETLRLNFTSINENDRQTVTEITRCALDLLSKDIGGYTQDRVSLTSNRHVETVSKGAADAYLEQFALKRPTDIVKTDLEIEYRPTAKIILSDKEDTWALHRLVEKSGVLPDGLFINTLIFISSPAMTAFEEQKRLIDRLYDLADQSLELNYVGDSDGDTTS